jgi:flagellar biogenesis protein FliO
MRTLTKIAPVIAVALWLPTAAQAYIGPGAGLGAIAVTLAVALGIVLLLIGFLWYPLKRLIRGRKSGARNASAADD